MVFNIVVELMSDFGKTNPAYNELKLVMKIVQQFEQVSTFSFPDQLVLVDLFLSTKPCNEKKKLEIIFLSKLCFLN